METLKKAAPKEKKKIAPKRDPVNHVREHEQIDKLFDLMDIDHDQNVTKFEFLEFLKEHKPTHGPFQSMAKLQTVFGFTNHSFINREDFHDVFELGRAQKLNIEDFISGKEAIKPFNADAAGATEDIYDMAGGGVVSIGEQDSIYDMAGGGVATSEFEHAV